MAVSFLEDSGPSAETYFDMERRTCPQPAALPISFSQCTHITPSTCVFISNLILELDLECYFSRSLDLFRSRQWAHLLLVLPPLTLLLGQDSSRTFISLGRAWASPTLAWLNWACVCVTVYICLFGPTTYCNIQMSEIKILIFHDVHAVYFR